MTDLVASRATQSILTAGVERLGSKDAVATRTFLAGVQSLPRFVFEIARTLDEHEQDGEVGDGFIVPGKPFPDWPYLHEVLTEYQENRLLLVEKARQLMLTWLFAAVVVWEVRQRPGQRWGWISLKEDTADEALSRMWAIIERLPGRAIRAQAGNKSFRDAGGVLWTRRHTNISVPQMAGNIHAMSQTADDCRSFTFSGLVFDEFAFMPLAKAGYSAAKPTIDKGRMIGITTPGAFGFVSDLYRGKAFGDDE